MSDMNDPYFNEFADEKPFSPEQGTESPRRRGCLFYGCIGVLIVPGDTVLNRMLFAAYSSANALLTAGIGDFDSTAKSAGAAPLG